MRRTIWVPILALMIVVALVVSFAMRLDYLLKEQLVLAITAGQIIESLHESGLADDLFSEPRTGWFRTSEIVIIVREYNEEDIGEIRTHARAFEGDHFGVDVVFE